MKLRSHFFLLLFAFAFGLEMKAQDTTTVQVFTFADITKRRDTIVCPDSSEHFRKILMYYTLKCDPATTHDQYDCGEWDYLTYTFVNDHRGKLDSTRKTNFNFSVGGSTPDSFGYRSTPFYDYFESWQYGMTHSGVISFDSALIGAGASPYGHPLKTNQLAGRSQYLWKASEFAAAGLNGGNLTGMRLNISAGGSTARNLVIRLRHTLKDSLTANSFETDSLVEVYRYHTPIPASGWLDLEFVNSFTWDGVRNIIVDISFDSDIAGSNITVNGDATAWSSGITGGGTDYFLEFKGGGDHVNLGAGAQRTGAQARTIEGWGYAGAFNDAGLFQAGVTGVTSGDFSLRTLGTDNNWRVQQWGTPDYDAVLANSKNNWHHYAVTYDGATSKLYYDGQLAASEACVLATGAHDIWLGRWDGAWLNGKIDAFRTWNSALTQQTISDWMRKELDPTHPDYASLSGDYRCNEGTGTLTSDISPASQADGNLMGGAWWRRHKGENLQRNFTATFSRPQIVFEQGVYSTNQRDSVLVTDSLIRAPKQIVFYNNPANGVQVADNSPVHPSLATDTITAWQGNVWAYTYNPSGVKSDSVWVGADTTLYKTTRIWYSPTVTYEIGRYITPYGIGLSLGPNGFTWIYDVTDYRPILMDSVDISAGNQQELIDLKLVFIHGEPPAEVVKIDQVWDKGAPSYSYANMDNDVSLSSKIIALNQATQKVRLKTRLTGHGHNSNNGQYPHCCEWKDNTHFIFANGVQVASWHIWQTHDCALNPVFPQGGTWPGSREGWCPGDLVKENEFDLSSYVTAGQITLDYDITPVPANNQGMGGGNYVAQFHLVETKAPNRSNDVELYDVTAPNNWGYVSRKNPICIEPKVVIRNSGSTNLTSATITYGVSGAPAQTYNWTGNLKYMDKVEVTLPVPNGGAFWNGDGSNIFQAIVSSPNGSADQYAANDTFRSKYNMPDSYTEGFIIQLRTNARPNDNSYTVKDIDGNVIISRSGFPGNWTYRDTLDLPPGCYTFELLDAANDGLYYWANTLQGTGHLRLYNLSGGLIKTFEPEFGRSVFYSFSIGDFMHVEDPNLDQDLSVFPNPNQGTFTLMADGYTGYYDIEVLDVNGRVIWKDKVVSGGSFTREIQFQATAGMYTLRMFDEESQVVRKIIVE